MKLSEIIINASPIVVKDVSGNDVTFPSKAQFIRPKISWEERSIEMLWRKYVEDVDGKELPIIPSPFYYFKATDETLVDPSTGAYVNANFEGAISEFDFYEALFNQPVSIINLVIQQGNAMVQMGRM